jgi:hypothetical protein
MFRQQYATYGNLFEALRYHEWPEGIRLWLVSLDAPPWVMLACFVLSWPLVLSRKGLCPPLFFAAAFAYLLFLMWSVDFWSDGNAWVSWLGPAGLARLAFLLMPCSAIWLGYHAILAARRIPLIATNKAVCEARPSGVMRTILGAVLLSAFNIACVIAGLASACWLRAAKLGPFAEGFWHGSAAFLPAPVSLHHVFAGDWSRYGALGWGAMLSACILSAALCTRCRGDGLHAFWIAFSGSGYPALWIVGDVLVNYAAFAGT